MEIVERDRNRGNGVHKSDTNRSSETHTPKVCLKSQQAHTTTKTHRSTSDRAETQSEQSKDKTENKELTVIISIQTDNVQQPMRSKPERLLLPVFDSVITSYVTKRLPSTNDSDLHVQVPLIG